MGLLLYRMEFPLRYSLEADAIVDFNSEVIAELSGGCRGDMEYLVLAANEKHLRDNNTELDSYIENLEQEWK